MVDKNITIIISIAVVILAGIFIAVFFEGSPLLSGEPGYALMMDSDRMFIEQMIPHHQDAIDMANLALVNAKHPEILQLSETIIRDQSREISLMREWYQAWYGTAVPVYPGAMTGTGMSMNQQETNMGMMRGSRAANRTDIPHLANATDFDKEFIEQMIPHHEMAIMMVPMTQNSGHTGMRELGISINRSQSAEVALMRDWYRSWYGAEVPLFSMHREVPDPVAGAKG